MYTEIWENIIEYFNFHIAIVAVQNIVLDSILCEIIIMYLQQFHSIYKVVSLLFQVTFKILQLAPQLTYHETNKRAKHKVLPMQRWTQCWRQNRSIQSLFHQL